MRILLCKADEDTRKQTTEIQKHTCTAESKSKSKKQFTMPKPTYQNQSEQSSFKTIRGCRYCGNTHGKVKARIPHMTKYVPLATKEIILHLCVCPANKLNQ